MPSVLGNIRSRRTDAFGNAGAMKRLSQTSWQEMPLIEALEVARGENRHILAIW